MKSRSDLDKAIQAVGSTKLAVAAAKDAEARVFAKLDDVTDDAKAFQSTHIEHERMVRIRLRAEREHQEAVDAEAAVTRALQEQELASIFEQLKPGATAPIRAMLEKGYDQLEAACNEWAKIAESHRLLWLRGIELATILGAKPPQVKLDSVRSIGSSIHRERYPTYQDRKIGETKIPDISQATGGMHG